MNNNQVEWFEFKTLEDVDKYWYRLEFLCYWMFHSNPNPDTPEQQPLDEPFFRLSQQKRFTIKNWKSAPKSQREKNLVLNKISNVENYDQIMELAKLNNMTISDIMISYEAKHRPKTSKKRIKEEDTEEKNSEEERRPPKKKKAKVKHPSEEEDKKEEKEEENEEELLKTS